MIHVTKQVIFGGGIGKFARKTDKDYLKPKCQGDRVDNRSLIDEVSSYEKKLP
jgi:hypothetical protein